MGVHVLSKKVVYYLTAKNELETRYRTVRDSTSAELRPALEDLYELDQLHYTYLAIRTYYENSKSQWHHDYRNQLDDFLLLQQETEQKLPVGVLNARVSGLATLRRDLTENAVEGGKLAAKLVLATSDLTKIDLSGLNQKQPHITSQNPQLNSSINTASNTANNTAINTASNSANNLASNSANNLANNLANNTAKNTANTTATNLTSNKANIMAGNMANYTPNKTANVIAQIPPAKQPSAVSKFMPVQLTPSHAKSISAQSASVGGFTFSTQRTPTFPERSVTQGTKRPREQGAAVPPQPEGVHDLDAFWQFRTWTREHCRCLIGAALRNQKDPNLAIQTAFQDEFNVSISVHTAEALRRHYGISEKFKDAYLSYNMIFREVANLLLNSLSHVIVPWIDLRHKFKSRSGYHISDWEIKLRYFLHLLHLRVYGPEGEPYSNFLDLNKAYYDQLDMQARHPLEFWAASQIAFGSERATNSHTRGS